MAYVIPLQVKDATCERRPIALVVILTKENLDRMKRGDPFDLQTKNYLSDSDIDLVIAYEEDESKIHELGQMDGPSALLSWIERGREHRPDLGDTAPPRSVTGRRGGAVD